MTTLAIASVLSVSSAGAVVVDSDSGYDPRDVETRDGFQPPDVASTTRELLKVHGRRKVAVIVRYHERSGGGRLTIRLDANGGPRVDHIMLIGSTGDPVCYVWPKGERRSRVRGHPRWSSTEISCRIRAWALHPDKSIRWKVRAEPNDGGFEPDFAPDGRGWYP